MCFVQEETATPTTAPPTFAVMEGCCSVVSNKHKRGCVGWWAVLSAILLFMIRLQAWDRSAMK